MRINKKFTAAALIVGAGLLARSAEEKPQYDYKIPKSGGGYYISDERPTYDGPDMTGRHPSMSFIDKETNKKHIFCEECDGYTRVPEIP